MQKNTPHSYPYTAPLAPNQVPNRNLAPQTQYVQRPTQTGQVQAQTQAQNPPMRNQQAPGSPPPYHPNNRQHPTAPNSPRRFAPPPHTQQSAAGQNRQSPVHNVNAQGVNAPVGNAPSASSLVSPIAPRSNAQNLPLQPQHQNYTDQNLLGDVETVNSKDYNEQSDSFMLLATIAFLIFYVLTTSSKLYRDHNHNKNTAISDHREHSQNVASQVSANIDNTIIWINNGLGEGQSPSQAARLISKSPFVENVIIVNADNDIIASSHNNIDYLKSVPLSQGAEGTYHITSLTPKNGKTIPVVVKKTGHYYVIAALSKNALLTKNTLRDSAIKIAIFSPQGKIIDGNDQFGQPLSQNMFSLNQDQISQILSFDSHILDNHKIDDQQHRVISSKVPKSNLRVIEARRKKETAILKGNLVLFGSLFLGTCFLVGMLLNSLQKKLASIRRIQRQTEISKQRYQAAVDGDHGGIWEMDIPNNSAYLSASLSSLLGMPRQEHRLTISQFLNLFHPQERDKFLATARRAHIQGEFEIDISSVNLQLVLECRGRPSTRSDGNFKRVIVGVALDITEQKRAQARLKAIEARLHNALSSMTDSFVVWDQANRLVLWNVRFEDFFQFGPNQLQVGMEHAQVDFMARPAIAEINANTENTQLSEVKLKDGRWIRYIETPTIEGGHVSVGTDITEIRLREAELRENGTALKNTVDVLRKSQDRIFELAEGYEQEKIRAEEANQSKTDFLASMSHELRTPLNAINGFSDIMKKEMFGPLGDPRYKEYISDILFSGQHLLALINDILDMSKIEAGKMTLNTEVIFMHDMIAQVVRIIRGRAEDAQLNLDVDVPEIREIEADPRAVKQILLNLITNAIKFTPEGGTVGVELVEKQSGLIISVRDSGIGISPENIDRLAKPFEQVVDTENKHKEGTGLGLALSKSLIELHGGTFKIESDLGSGTVVTFTLPNTPVVQKVDEFRSDDVTHEISRLAQDIAHVLGDENVIPHQIQEDAERPAA